MTALFIRDSQIAASLPPLEAMGQDAAPTGAKLSEDMREFMAQGAINFARMLKQSRVQRNDLLPIIRAARSCFQARIPFNTQFRRDSHCAIGAQ
jgi:hypothetical protein